MANHPLAEVFGYPIGNMSEEAITHRENRLCPYHNVIPQCTKDSRIKPLGVCSIFDGNEAVITCPIRFRQNWYITADAAKFFFPGGTRWTAVPEVGLRDKSNLSVGKVDFILAAHDEYGRIIDFAALEVQASRLYLWEYSGTF